MNYSVYNTYLCPDCGEELDGFFRCPYDGKIAEDDIVEHEDNIDSSLGFGMSPVDFSVNAS